LELQRLADRDQQRGAAEMSAAVGNPCLDIALLALDVGLSPVPPKEDGTKAPIGEWKEFQTVPATEELVRGWYRNGRSANGLVTGYGHLEAFEFDNGETYQLFLETASETGLDDLVARIRAGYEETTPGGGIHWLYRCKKVRGNTKLAERPNPDDPNKRDVLIETRGQGGFIIVAPSNGSVHPSGGAYRLCSGGLRSIVTLTAEERDELWRLAQSFDEATSVSKREHEPRIPVQASGDYPDIGKSPGDDLEEQYTWADILEPHGWDRVHRRGDVECWRRPGKDQGVSATTGHCKGLKVFSTSTAFKSEGTYTKFGAYALLHHQGDFKEATKKLVAEGFGTWIDNDGTEKENPPPPGWKRARSKTTQAHGKPADLAWIESRYATLADADQSLGAAEWAWRYWALRGALAGVVADPGVGKTRVVCDWCKRLWTKDAMPDGTDNPFPPGTKTLWLLYDRNWRGLIRNARAFGLPLESIILPAQKDQPLFLPDFDDRKTMDILKRFIEVHTPGFVVIDSTTYASVWNTGKPNESKIAYDPIMDLLMDTNTAGVGITHTNAQGGVLNRRLLERLRTKVVISRPDPGQPSRLRIECDKSEDKLPPPLGAEFTDTAVVYDYTPPGAPAAPARGRKPTTSPGIADFLWTFLEAGPAPVMDIIQAARDRGLLKSQTQQEPKPSLSPLYDARGWITRLHPGKKIGEFSATTERGKTLKHWEIIEASSDEPQDAPF
jgi:hypothetical protein